MTYFYYKTNSWSNQQPKVSEENLKLWKTLAEKENWRIVQLPNGYYQTEYELDDSWNDVTRRETIDGAEAAIDSSVDHFKRKLKALEGPTVVKTFK
jgi:hypothetical protein